VSLITIPYSARRWQHETDRQLLRFNVLVVHRRSGKTVKSINWLIREALQCPAHYAKTAVCAYVCPQFAQAKRIAWPYLQHYAGAIPDTKFNASELCAILPTGMRIYLLGAENPNPIRGLSLWACVSDECAQQPRSAWTQVLRPALSDMAPHGGGKATFIGTPMGRANLFAELAHPKEPLPGWFNTDLKWFDTNVIDPDEIEALKREMPDEDFKQEYENSFDASIKGAYLGKAMAQAESDGRITSVPYEPSLPVTVAYDLGVHDSFVAVFVQTVGGEVRVIDHLEVNNMGLPEIVRLLNQKPYVYDRHLFPHDIKVRELGTGKSRVETLQSLGIRAEVVRSIPLMDGISAARGLIQRCWFDREKAFTLVEALKLYRSEYNEVKQVLSNAPLHDWTSHHADSFRMLAVGLGRTLGTASQPIDYGVQRRATA